MAVLEESETESDAQVQVQVRVQVDTDTVPELPPNLAHVQTLLIVFGLPPELLESVRRKWKQVHYLPVYENGAKEGDDVQELEIPDDVLRETEVVWGFRLPDYVTRDKVPNLVWVHVNSAGFDWILKSKLFSPSFPKNPPILLTGASGVHAKVIGEHVISLSLALFHRVNWLAIKGWNERKWTPVDRIRGIGGRSGLSFIRELGGQTMGVLGYGHLGRESARLAKAFGMDVLACNSTGVRSVDNGFVIPGSGDPEGLLPSAWYSSKDPSSFREFLSRTDVLVVALPLTPSTRHIISSTALSHLSPTSIIINVGRGPLVDTTALLDALRWETIGGAGLDVTDPEPLPDGHELWGFDNVVITPHISWAGLHVREAHVQLFVQQTDRVRSRKAPYNVFDPDRGY